jgi:hypothetical protein
MFKKGGANITAFFLSTKIFSFFSHFFSPQCISG